MLTTTLIKNLANMDHTSKRNTVRISIYIKFNMSDLEVLFNVCVCVFQLENVCQVAGRQGSSVREKAAFVVLCYTLLQSLESMTESQHLHTAQSVYKLLESSLLHQIQSQKVRAPSMHPCSRGMISLCPRVSCSFDVKCQVCHEGLDACVPVCAGLGEFLQMENRGVNAEKAHSLLLLSLLQLFINTLRCSQSTFKGTAMHVYVENVSHYLLVRYLLTSTCYVL